MPAILEDEDWPVWLGEEDATPQDAKAVLTTMEGVNWTAAPEPKGTRPGKSGLQGAPTRNVDTQCSRC